MKKILLVVLVLLQTGLVLPVFPARPTDEQMEGRLSNYCTDSRFKRRRYANYCKKIWLKNEKAYCTYAADKPRYKLAFDELCGDVKLATPAKPSASEPEKKTPPAAAGDADRELWDLVKDSNDENMIKMYLQTYPQGQYAVHARVLLLKLKKSANAQTPASQSPAPKTSPPAAKKGSIRISSEPSRASIYINDVFSGTSPLDIPIKPGLYAVEARKSGYKSESKRIRVFEGQDLALTLILDKAGSSLYITSTPSGADVHIDNAYSGQTPLSLKGLSPGLRMTVKISKQNYQDWQQRVTIGSADRTLQATLNRQQTAPADMVLIEAGEFMMGSEDGQSDEKPVHRVYLDAYYIDKHEVTVADYRKCVSAGSCREFTTRYWSGKDQGRSSYCNWTASGREQHPINCVDWPNAKAYCEWAGKRLPTEAEWEKAASRKNETKYKYPSGKNSVSCTDAVLREGGYGCGKNSTWPAGSKPGEINGTYDMAGNVWEWVADWYGGYSGGTQRNPKGPSTGSRRVIRGGSWRRSASFLRGANRRRSDPSSRSSRIGFRCARSPVE